MSDNVIRRDIIQIAWEVEDSPLSKIAKQAREFQSTVKRAVGGGESELEKFSRSAQKSISGFKKLKDSIKAVDKASLKKITKGVTDLNSKISKGLVTGAKKAAKAVAKLGVAGAAGFGALATASVNAYSDYEQLKGGVETLFGAGGMGLKDYADSMGKSVSEVAGEYRELMKAQSIVMDNANNAYTSAGMSANEYMETVTSFAASLKQSLGGDTVKAAEKADLALTDMSDNANKMGTDMENIKNAYQGFAKQNYTMLDNLKLGYGGTKEEMERLLKDAQKLSGQKYDISSYADIVDAIHVVQTEMGITGTTAEEASTTIQGSFGSMKAAWTNFLTGMADPDQNFDALCDNLINSVITFGENIIPTVMRLVPRLGQGLVVLGKAAIKYAMPALESVGLAPIAQKIGDAVSNIKGKFQALTQDSGKMATIKDIFNGIKTAVSYAAEFAGKLVTNIIDFCTQAPVLKTIKAIVSGVSKVVKFLADHFDALSNVLVFVIGFIGSLAAIIIVLVKNWDKVKEAALNCWNKIKGAWSGVKGWFSSKVVTPVKNFFVDLWEEVPAPVKDVIGKITDGFQTAYDKVTGAWENITTFFSDLWKDVVKAVAKPVNKLIDGANWVMDKLGSDKEFGHWEPYAQGTSGHRGGNAMVNDGRGAELVQMPNGATFIPRGRNVMLPNAPKGMKVLNAEKTAQLMGRSSPTFNYADGTGWDLFDFFSALKMEGLHTADNVKRTLYQMQTESGGNPKAINNWDVNARKGTPSKGLMQVIDPTFKAYARKGYASNIYDPLSNILASVRYAKARYGSLAKAYRGVGYANGVGRINLPAYSPASSVPASRVSSATNNNYSPSFTLNMSGTVDRTTERTIKKWVREALEEIFTSMERTSPRVQEV